MSGLKIKFGCGYTVVQMPRLGPVDGEKIYYMTDMHKLGWCSWAYYMYRTRLRRLHEQARDYTRLP